MGSPAPSAREIWRYIERIIDDIKKFDDGKKSNDFYKQCINTVINFLEKHGPFFNLFVNEEKSLNILLSDDQFIQQAAKAMTITGLNKIFPHTNKEELRNSIEDALLLFDMQLMNALIIRAMHYYLNDSNPIFICAGAYHIKAIRPLLKKLGYTNEVLGGNEMLSYFDDPASFLTEEPSVLALADYF